MTDPTDLRDRLVAAFQAAAYDCDGACGKTERECDAEHPIQVAAWADAVSDVYGPVANLAEAVLAVVQAELDAKEAERDQWERRYDAEAMTTAGIFHTYYQRWQATITEARRQDRRADLAEQHVEELQDKLLSHGVNGGCCCSYDNPGDICMVHSPTVRKLEAEAEALRADRDALLHRPVLRLCVYPTCLREYDASASADGRPARPEWSSRGWYQVRALGGDVCPDHAVIVRDVHQPRWSATGRFLVCSCGWESPPVRWRGYGVEAWKDHVLPDAADTTPDGATAPSAKETT